MHHMSMFAGTQVQCRASMFLGDGHIRGLLMLDMPDGPEHRALLREAVLAKAAAMAPSCVPMG
jgi:hypothetical protein